jgi:hypothetical protein
MSLTAAPMRFSPDVTPDRGDIVMLHLLDYVNGKAEACEAECIDDGEWRSVRTGQVFGYGKRDKLLMGWTALSENQQNKYAQRR